MGSFYKLTATDLEKNLVDFSSFENFVCLVVNVASKCGLTESSYKNMNELYEKYKSQNFIIFAFPCNQFGNQEFATNQEIKKFVDLKGISFPVFHKGNVNGSSTQPVYAWLKQAFPGDITWNFHTKFLVGKSGKPVMRFDKKATWKEIEDAIVKELSRMASKQPI